MSIFSDSDRAYLSEMRGLTTDPGGNEVLVGLTLVETKLYMAFTNGKQEGKDFNDEQTAEYLSLHAKYESARLDILVAENQLRIDRPDLH